MLDRLEVPVIAAPMAGGASTPELVAEVGRAGGLGFLAAGYLTAAALADQVAATSAAAGDRFGVNLFVPGPKSTVDLRAYRERVRAQSPAEPGEPRWDDDDYAAKLELVMALRVPVVSFTFGLPDAHDVARLHAAGTTVVVTVTTPAEARQAAQVGADALCVQGCDAGGHRGTFADDGVSPGGGELFGVLAALRLVRARVDLPLIATGGLVHGADVAAVLAAGAVAAQLGTAFLACPEAGTNPVHRAALADGTRRTALTRAFSGRPARGLVNRFLTENSPAAPAAYPQVHHLTKPVRATGDPELMSLWAGQTYALVRPAPAAEVVARLHTEARQALAAASRRIPPL
ncbi:nitronate monooxygenase [Actinosynnema sp. NPDC047251]|uniref:Propionate 3-nitronate monooxygenase n=1 Tax=Saccharothrix espanaensis (strain ATCC 51144 / DSM 44229 / JCM 9112 / NBRC 15066 / NRRL 15764) TaxID=1179773 RepID=K0JSE0_SACES|nr:nitronate monooxygenase [Saccharothrix espanaensis]CCH28786.1 2-nitropropane dioxygenase (NPD)-like protein [Saccharothrix espanaensis DSM 44229]